MNIEKWECGECGFVYNEALGLPEEVILPGTKWKDIPDDWICPDCGVKKTMFVLFKETSHID